MATRAIAVRRGRRIRLASLGDYPPAYATWVSAVKYAGGAAVVWPASLAPTANAGKPAARYEKATYDALVKAGRLTLSSNDKLSASGYVYVLAPADAIAAAKQLATITRREEDLLPRESLLDRWLPGVSGYVKLGLMAGAGVALLALYRSLSRGRRRD